MFHPISNQCIFFFSFWGALKKNNMLTNHPLQFLTLPYPTLPQDPISTPITLTLTPSCPWQVTPLQFDRFPQQLAGTHLNSWVERGTVRVKCLSQEHNTVSPTRARTQTALSGDERTNHDAIVPAPCCYGHFTLA